jgi:predicted acyltransferase
MGNITKATVMLMSVLAVVITANYTLDSNLRAGIYPIDADSIGIPLFQIAAESLVILSLLLIAFVITSFSFFSKRILHVLGILLFLLAAFLAGNLAWHWLIPRHYSIGVSCVFVAVVAVTLAALALRQPPSNPALKRDCRKSAAAP